ncbi:hypothetical protein F5X99DRAFT_430167 [Biscogniauxia marginata]|nr:hypothetical protein F5X99DRAFT_430167 [Biscogniauxia marginata]
MTSFVTPNVSLNPSSDSNIRTIPDLVEFHVKNNPDHAFCLQAEKVSGQSRYSFVRVTYERLQRAILRCQTWLRNQIPGIHPPIIEHDGIVKKCAPIAILMENHVGLAVYVLTLMGMGVPVVLLSARLSSLAVRHLIQETGAKFVITSLRLQPITVEAFLANGHNGNSNAQIGLANNDEDGDHGAKVCLAAEYGSFLEKGTVQSGDIAHPGHYISEMDREVLILHSSGTSGLPKPIYCSHRHFLGFGKCHSFTSDTEAQSLTISTSPFFHGFGLVPICLSLGIGKTFCIPPPSVIPTGSSVTALIQDSGAKALLTVPSVLEEIVLLPERQGIYALKSLDFVAFGGGLPKASVGGELESAGVRLINHYGATETGPLTPFFVPPKGHDWHYLKLRSDTLEPLDVKLDPVDQADQLGQAYKLSMKPFGWRERFELQDLLVSTPGGVEGEFSIAGRTDDLICLATGEKVRPTILESLLRQHTGVKAATAFGDNQFELCVIVEPTHALEPDQVEAFKLSIWPVIEDASHKMDAHAKISSPEAILVVPPGALPRSDKGTILRLEVRKKFAEEIADVYRNIETNVDAPTLDLASPESGIRALITEKIEWRVPLDDWSDDDDFFELGMDSLQAAKLRRVLAASVKATESNDNNVSISNIVTDDFIYRNPSIKKLADALATRHSMVNGVSESAIIERLADLYSGRLGSHQKKVTVVITGASGSLGSYFLSRLLGDDSVGRVVCLNRPSNGNPFEKQKHAMKSRGISVHDDVWSKVEIYETNTASPHLGLEDIQYERIATEMTHVVHIAWPMSFKMQMPSFTSAFRSLQNLVQLGSQAHRYNPWKRPRVLFISSISTVGNYPTLCGERLVPETCVEDNNWTMDLGYAKAKLICEKIMYRASIDHPEIEVGFVRVGQIAGACSGYWNADEHFVALVRSSQKIGKFPDLRGTLSWLPVDSAASSLAEIIFDSRPLHLVYHLENPIRQGWQDVVWMMLKELDIPSNSIIPFQKWLHIVALTPETGNPARKLINFLEAEFSKMSCGSLLLDTSVSRSVSPTLRKIGPVGADDIKAYVAYWRSVKILE